jgi:transcriptional regulator with XRE-family HTH domain|nr:MAG TPA: SOS-response transcriptional repressor [Caudoviricetes sp.]
MLEKVKKLAKKKGLSIAALESKAEIGNGTISRWDKSKPNLKTLEKIAIVLEVPVSELLEQDV